jgi:hypothetical protein
MADTVGYVLGDGESDPIAVFDPAGAVGCRLPALSAPSMQVRS